MSNAIFACFLLVTCLPTIHIPLVFLNPYQLRDIDWISLIGNYIDSIVILPRFGQSCLPAKSDQETPHAPSEKTVTSADELPDS